MRWIEALKVWNTTKRECNPAHVWCTPRRDTPEHKEVKEIMERAKPEAVEARNVERRKDTLSRLRAEEAKSKVRNYERRKEAEAVLKLVMEALKAKDIYADF